MDTDDEYADWDEPIPEDPVMWLFNAFARYVLGYAAGWFLCMRLFDSSGGTHWQVGAGLAVVPGAITLLTLIVRMPHRRQPRFRTSIAVVTALPTLFLAALLVPAPAFLFGLTGYQLLYGAVLLPRTKPLAPTSAEAVSH